MINTIKKVSTFTMAISATALLAACTNTCGGHNRMEKTHHKQHGAPQAMMVYEAEAVEVMEMQPMTRPTGMKAQMHTNNSRGGTSPMGYIKFNQGDNCIKMTVDVTDLRPDKDYTMKIYPCGNCNDYSCCDSKSMDVKLPTLSVDEPGRLTKTYKIRGVDCSELKNAKVVLTRDGGYKASWGRIEPNTQQ